jgi:hypothetical protein
MNRFTFLAAKARRLSSLRVSRFGPLPEDQGEWWRQITVVAEANGLDTSWEEWMELHEIERDRHAKQDGLPL